MFLYCWELTIDRQLLSGEDKSSVSPCILSRKLTTKHPVILLMRHMVDAMVSPIIVTIVWSDITNSHLSTDNIGEIFIKISCQWLLLPLPSIESLFAGSESGEMISSEQEIYVEKLSRSEPTTYIHSRTGPTTAIILGNDKGKSWLRNSFFENKFL